MPIYEYRCGKCQHKLETLQKFSDAPLVTCPACGEPALAKLVSAAGFQLKGSGWYQTDFRGSGGKKPDKPEGDKAASTEPAAKSETKTEAAPAKSDATPAATPAAPTSTPGSSAS